MNAIVDAQLEFYKRLPDLKPVKQCSRCKADKPHTEFHKHCRSPDGLRSACKPCTLTANAESYVRRREKRYNAAKVAELSRQLQSKEMNGAPVGIFVFFVLLIVITGFTSCYLLMKAEQRDWTAVTDGRA